MFSLFKKSTPAPNKPATTNIATAQPKGITAALGATFKQFQHAVLGGKSDNPQEQRPDATFYDALEEGLLLADVGLDTALHLVESVQQHKPATQSQALNTLKEECEALFKEASKNDALTFSADSFSIVLLVGVNGAGKTTLIGKLAHQCAQQGLGVTIAAGDTFRAAAEEQLGVWAKRANASLITHPNGDAAAVMHEAITHAQANNHHVVLLDTAGRLQNQHNLMAELQKINTVISKVAPANSVRHNLLVLDATTGQNGLKQADIFNQSVAITGVALTKLDGSAKGGVALAIAHELKHPILLVGTGEAIADLQPFVADDYINGLLPNTTQ